MIDVPIIHASPFITIGKCVQSTAFRSEQEHWTASMQYNELGQEIERILPGMSSANGSMIRRVDQHTIE
ncbi:hypothetical protein [Lysinibacillus sp. NPDC093692]|uniref:hypothetical protein n=1 Tax=Lysinibacillus sp. NPDC093692 TaxID=3390578 RepID=UPI003CFF08E8